MLPTGVEGGKTLSVRMEFPELLKISVILYLFHPESNIPNMLSDPVYHLRKRITRKASIGICLLVLIFRSQFFHNMMPNMVLRLRLSTMRVMPARFF